MVSKNQPLPTDFNLDEWKYVLQEFIAHYLVSKKPEWPYPRAICVNKHLWVALNEEVGKTWVPPLTGIRDGDLLSIRGILPLGLTLYWYDNTFPSTADPGDLYLIKVYWTNGSSRIENISNFR
jgi:hypothetical protein